MNMQEIRLLATKKSTNDRHVNFYINKSIALIHALNNKESYLKSYNKKYQEKGYRDNLKWLGAILADVSHQALENISHQTLENEKQ